MALENLLVQRDPLPISTSTTTVGASIACLANATWHAKEVIQRHVWMFGVRQSLPGLVQQQQLLLAVWDLFAQSLVVYPFPRHRNSKLCRAHNLVHHFVTGFLKLRQRLFVIRRLGIISAEDASYLREQTETTHLCNGELQMSGWKTK